MHLLAGKWSLSVRDGDDSSLGFRALTWSGLFFFYLLMMYNLQWIVQGHASTLTGLILDVSEVELRVGPQRSYSKVPFHSQICLDSKQQTACRPEFKPGRKHFLSMSSVRQLQWNFRKTPPHTDQRRMETEAQTLEGEGTQVSNCSNTDVMKWIQIR